MSNHTYALAALLLVCTVACIVGIFFLVRIPIGQDDDLIDLEEADANNEQFRRTDGE